MGRIDGTRIALGSTAVALVFGGLFSAFAVDFARLTGLTEDSATLQQPRAPSMFAGLPSVASSSARWAFLTTSTTTQTATVFELQDANPGLSAVELFSRAA
ncbi:MAG: hypothetical protein U0360_06410 [Dehalococcoidia bacterium]